jgi:AcrR family transcriptional regulator
MSSKKEQRARETREAIFAAAAKVVGRVGYAKASMAAIAMEAGVSYGKIYSYFENQQDLFNQLLPHIGEAMLSYIAERTREGKTTLERERLGIEANLHYVHLHPELHRVLNEAAFFAPDSYRAYFKRMVESYRRSLLKGIRNGELAHYSEEETETLALMFIGAREYILQHYTTRDGKIEEPPLAVQQSYLKAFAMALANEPAAPGSEMSPTETEAPRRRGNGSAALSAATAKDG